MVVVVVVVTFFVTGVLFVSDDSPPPFEHETKENVPSARRPAARSAVSFEISFIKLFLIL